MRSFCFFLTFATLFSVNAAQAGCKPDKNATPIKVCYDQPCDTIGESVIDADEQNIIACLKDSSGTKKWKAVTQSSESSSSFPKNHSVIGNRRETPSCLAYTDSRGRPFISVNGGNTYTQTEIALWVNKNSCNSRLERPLCGLPDTPCLATPRGLTRAGSPTIPW